MDSRVKKYQQVIKKILSEHAEYRSKWGGSISQLVFDDERGRYLVLDVGWEDEKYWHITPIHLDVIDGKIWIQYDDTEEGVATELIEAGVPQEDIVLGFRHPTIRPYTGFATGEEVEQEQFTSRTGTLA